MQVSKFAQAPKAAGQLHRSLATAEVQLPQTSRVAETQRKSCESLAIPEVQLELFRLPNSRGRTLKHTQSSIRSWRRLLSLLKFVEAGQWLCNQSSRAPAACSAWSDRLAGPSLCAWRHGASSIRCLIGSEEQQTSNTRFFSTFFNTEQLLCQEDGTEQTAAEQTDTNRHL